ncbi:carbamoyl phosphate synthase small subunit [Treponema brennaborense]|uniref:Carbamoyl phosphate synthase small chain n=1 Tax=Treponema brennaborense (strain DSM 12168 / CIP 105900 / DD5/3) TaxID=906968 RepID=F4LMD4_TREBD|nr:carbamoyl phosphate synthase small subunit [Treponema brennaborense]AEE15696.1 carbamoyl-phosphate synthase, small subunit [Treponema brennaborense DSM 12168]
MNTKAYIVLASGQVFEGKSFGACGCITGEAVFTTGMTGYLETLTDPSYYGQIVMQTFPLIGNYGEIPADFESAAPHVRGYIVRNWCEVPSNFRCAGTLDAFLKKHGIIGIYDVDTRALTKIIRESGVMNARLIAFSGDSARDVQAAEEAFAVCAHSGLAAKAAKTRLLEEIKSFKIENAVASVTGSAAGVEKSADRVFAESAAYRAVPVTAEGLKMNDPFEAARAGKNADGSARRVVLWDFGAKANIRRELLKRGVEVVTVPSGASCADILALDPDGVMLSNGPGDPAENTVIIEELHKLTESGVPLFGICLGHQLLALARGAKTEKLKYGHRGANQPVKEVSSGRVYISSQNHGYAVVSDSLPAGAELSFINTNDGTCEGVSYTDFPGFSVQFHPEASGGPLDTGFLFDRFIALIADTGFRAGL